MRKRNRLLTGLAALAILTGLLTEGDVAAASLTSKVEITIKGTLTESVDLAPGGAISAPVFSQIVKDFANGSGANQANVIWSDRRTLTASATEDLDLVGGGLLNAFGVAIAPTKIRLVYIVSSSANVQNLTLFGDAASIPILGTAATTYTLQPGGVFLGMWPSTAGLTVTPTTGDIIQVANGAGVSVTYDIVVVGSL